MAVDYNRVSAPYESDISRLDLGPRAEEAVLLAQNERDADVSLALLVEQEEHRRFPGGTLHNPLAQGDPDGNGMGRISFIREHLE